MTGLKKLAFLSQPIKWELLPIIPWYLALSHPLGTYFYLEISLATDYVNLQSNWLFKLLCFWSIGTLKKLLYYNEQTSSKAKEQLDEGRKQEKTSESVFHRSKSFLINTDPIKRIEHIIIICSRLRQK